MKLDNFINLQLLNPINVIIIILIAAIVPFGVAAIANPPKHPSI